MWACPAAGGARWQSGGRCATSAAQGSSSGVHSSSAPPAAQPTETEPAADSLLASNPAHIAAELRRVEARLAKLYADSAVLQERESALVAAEDRLQRQAGCWGSSTAGTRHS